MALLSAATGLEAGQRGCQHHQLISVEVGLTQWLPAGPLPKLRTGCRARQLLHMSPAKRQQGLGKSRTGCDARQLPRMSPAKRQYSRRGKACELWLRKLRAGCRARRLPSTGPAKCKLLVRVASPKAC